MKATQHSLNQLIDDQSLVSISRTEFDDNPIQAFVLHISSSHVLIQKVFDFHLDGIQLLRISDITDIGTDATEAFQKELLIKEGVFSKINFSQNPPISSYQSFLNSLPKNEIIILEDEASSEPDFLMGTLIAVNNQEVMIRYFDGTAEWAEEPSTIDIDLITSIQVNSNYIRFYARHFSRHNT